MALPVRGNVQVRVVELTANEAVLVTLGGHPLAGAIRFLSEQIADLIRFQIQVYDRPANLADWVAMRTVGEGMQARSWESLLQAIVVESGAKLVSSIQHEEEVLDDDQARRVCLEGSDELGHHPARRVPGRDERIEIRVRRRVASVSLDIDRRFVAPHPYPVSRARVASCGLRH